jgi:hypothetical protein
LRQGHAQARLLGLGLGGGKLNWCCLFDPAAHRLRLLRLCRLLRRLLTGLRDLTVVCWGDGIAF